MNMQKNKMRTLQKQSNYACLILGAWLLMLQVTSVWAGNTAITELNFSSLAGDKIQIQLGMNGPAVTPKVFQTDNPARIALDFAGVTSGLEKKLYSVNQGAAGAVYVVEASGRTRVIINLTETVPYETRVDGNKVYVILKPISAIITTKTQGQEKQVDRKITRLLPEQTIKNIDFRRGPKGEGRLLLALSTPNTVVDVQERGGKVILNFLNTKLPDALVKRFDVADFATPVQTIDAQPRGAGVTISIATIDGNYDYSSYQSDGLLTVDFLPLTRAEKEAKLKEKFAYVGNKLSLNFQEIEVRAVLQILADFTDLNIVAADSVGGNVSLRLNDVPWDQALDLILKSKGLAKRRAGNVVMVAPTAEIIKIEEEELAANRVVEQLEPLRTEYIQINYAKAEDIQVLLVGSNVVKSAASSASGSDRNSGVFGGSNSTASRSSRTTEMSDTRGVLSIRGSSTVDSRTNTIIVKDTAKQLEEIREMIRILDVPVRQVMIESRIVIADNNFAQEIGVKFGVAKAASVNGGKVFALGAEPTFGELIPDDDGSFVTVPDGPGYLVDLGANAINAHPVGALGMTLARAADYVLNLELSALENENRGEVLANPRVMTSDRELAFIKQGVQIPYTTVSQDGTQTQLIDAVLELNVTPQITPDGDVIMDLLIKKDAPNVAGGIDKREIETMVRVSDGETIVLGGVYEGDSINEQYRIPFFGDLPGVGFLFKKKIESDRKRELLIFVTPKIIKDSLSLR
ncbi:MAG: type IV pilus secretin PilQ [Methylomarinum sp.]|nr:type IV pilus secretin PilQ [Methylomarinum sp.]